MTHPRQSMLNSHIPVNPFASTMPWECAKCTYINKGSPTGKGPYIMCMHDDPPHIKVEVKDVGASPPSPARKITGTVTRGDLMADMANLEAIIICGSCGDGGSDVGGCSKAQCGSK